MAIAEKHRIIAKLLALCCLTSGCGSRPATDIRLEGLPYDFPADAVDRIVRPEDGMTYVRLNEIQPGVILIFDSRVNRAERKRGELTLATLNFGRFAKTEKITSEGRIVICRNRLGLNCGIRIDDQGTLWTALFARDRLSRVDEVEAAARLMLNRYRI